MESFESLEVWRRSSRLCVRLYKDLASCADLGFKSQITQSALSIPSNIAEGYERGSTKDYLRFLRIAKGSGGELRTQLYIGRQAGFIADETGRDYSMEVAEISKMLQGMIRALEANI